MRPRTTDGSWMRNFSPIGKGFNMPGFVESNAAIFTYYVPHNIKDLIYLIGEMRLLSRNSTNSLNWLHRITS